MASAGLVLSAAVLVAVGLLSTAGLAAFYGSIGASVLAVAALARSAATRRTVEEPGPGEPVAGEPVFPIADYDELGVDEVLGLLPQLYSDELDVVEARERRGGARRSVLAALGYLRVNGTEADREFAARVAEHEASGGE